MITFERDGDRWIACADVVVGVEHRSMRAEIGSLTFRPDPRGLRSIPVVTVPPGRTVLARAGVRRAGGGPSVRTLPADVPDLAGRLLLAVAEGTEVVFVEDGRTQALVLARILGGRPLPCLPFEDPGELGALVGDLEVDVNVAIPVSTEGARVAARRALVSCEPTCTHHLVEVDPRPAFDELGWSAEHATLGDLAAAATGVLAGRLAAANRRWRAG